MQNSSVRPRCGYGRAMVFPYLGGDRFCGVVRTNTSGDRCRLVPTSTEQILHISGPLRGARPHGSSRPERRVDHLVRAGRNVRIRICSVDVGIDRHRSPKYLWRKPHKIGAAEYGNTIGLP